MSRHLRQDRPLHEVDCSKSSLGSSADSDRARRVDTQRVDPSVQAETTVGGEELEDWVTSSGIPEDQSRVFRAGDDALACDELSVEILDEDGTWD